MFYTGTWAQPQEKDLELPFSHADSMQKPIHCSEGWTEYTTPGDGQDTFQWGPWVSNEQSVMGPEAHESRYKVSKQGPTSRDIYHANTPGKWRGLVHTLSAASIRVLIVRTEEKET